MRRFAFIIGAALPLLAALPALAEDVVIRIEAKRGTEAARATAREWGAQFPDVVTFPLADDWVGIALGPMPREAANARLTALKNDRKVPGDSFLAPAAGRELTPVTAPAPASPAPAATASPGSTYPAGDMPQPGAAGPTTGDLAGTDSPAVEITAAPAPAEPVAIPTPPQFFLRIESTRDRAKAEEMLAKWRETLPEAGLWSLPNGRLAVGFGPLDAATGKAWLGAFRAAGLLPKDAALTAGEDMGEAEIIGARPDLPPAPAADAAPLAMPPVQDIQRALRWAGQYDGAIDGKDGPQTREAMAREIARLRVSPDPATAMAELIRRRAAWRAEVGLSTLSDSHTGLSLPAPMDRLQFDRTERALSIYGPRDGSGAALILFSQPGGQQEMLDLAGLVTALGWVPAPERQVERGRIQLDGRNQTHIGHAEGAVVDGRVQGFVLIWPVSDPEGQRRLAAEISDNLSRFAPGATENPPDSAPIPAQD